MKKNKILITGVCGFIGFHLTNYFTSKGFQVTGLDNLRKHTIIFTKKKDLKF